jgi:hypothetical protein
MTIVGEILVGIDGSPDAAAALRWALVEAALRGDAVTALYAWGHAAPGHVGGGHTFDSDYGARDADAALAAAIGAAAVSVLPAGRIRRRPAGACGRGRVGRRRRRRLRQLAPCAA